MARRARSRKTDKTASTAQTLRRDDEDEDDIDTGESEAVAGDTEDAADAEQTRRDTELANEKRRGGKALRKKLLKLYADIEEGFIKQAVRADDQIDYWDCYDCSMSGNQAYNGNSQIYVPIIHDAVEARVTRFVNQLFPKGGRYVEAVTSDTTEPYAITALLEHYVRKSRLRTEVAPALVRNGDMEGQYNVYVSWSTLARHVVWKERKPPKLLDAEIEGIEPDIEVMKSDVVLDEHPVVEVLADSDVLLMPATANSVDEALALGGSATIIRRWTKGEIEQMVAEGEVDEDAGDDLIKSMGALVNDRTGQRNMPMKHADAAGIKAKGKLVLGYETWTRLKVDGQTRLCVVRFGSDKIILSCRRNPYWSDLCPLVSVPVKKVAGIGKGIAPVKACTKMQYAANDAINEAMDSATYALLPIVMTDPLKNPKTGTMVLDLAAVWETSPNDTKFAQFPELWKSGFEIVNACTQSIFRTLAVNPAMMTQGTSRQKRNQAELATEQQVDILTTADAVTVLEEGIFTPILLRFAAMDAQFRNAPATVQTYGYMGMRAVMEAIPPLQLDNRYSFRWYGVEQARNAAQIQQQIAFLNVMRGIPPQLLPGRKINMVPAIEHAAAAVFGPRLAPAIFEDVSQQKSFDPELESKMLAEGHDWPISPLDDDERHIEVHMQVMAATGDPSGRIQQHILRHRMAQLQKAQAQRQEQGGEGAPGQPGTPGGPPRAPGIAGVPRPGGQVAAPRLVKGPPGAINPDRMPAAGAIGMPRKS